MQPNTESTGARDKSSEEKLPIADQLKELKQLELDGYGRRVKRARNALVFSALIVLIPAMIPFFTEEDYSFDNPGMVISFLFSGAFALCAFWTRTKPYTGLIAGIIAFFVYMVADMAATAAIQGPDGIIHSLIQGLGFKAIMIFLLFRPLSEAKELQRANDEEAHDR